MPVANPAIKACFDVCKVVLEANKWLEVDTKICEIVISFKESDDPYWKDILTILESHGFHHENSFVKVPNLKRFKVDLQEKFVKKYYGTKLQNKQDNKKDKKISALTSENLNAFNEKNEELEYGPKIRRHFACEPCNFRFWDTVREKKPFSQCRECKNFYKAVPKDKEIGRGKFRCECGNEWTSPSCMWSLAQKCLTCNIDCFPYKLGPNLSAPGKRKSNRKHYCDACLGNPNCPILKAKCTAWSIPHNDHSGSTDYGVTTMTASSVASSYQSKQNNRRYIDRNNLGNKYL